MTLLGFGDISARYDAVFDKMAAYLEVSVQACITCLANGITVSVYGSTLL